MQHVIEYTGQKRQQWHIFIIIIIILFESGNMAHIIIFKSKFNLQCKKTTLAKKILIVTFCAVIFMHRHITAFFATSHTPLSSA